MIDNRPKEQLAETLVIHHLLKYDIKTSKPLFDEEGTDLLLIDQVTRNSTSIIRAQSKYRSYSKGKPNKVTIPVKYVSANFILFLYIIDESDNDGLYVFFEEDLKKWTINKNNQYSFLVSGKIIDNFREQLFSAATAKRIKEDLKKVEIKKYTSLIIDGIFLENAIETAKSVYAEIWPNRTLDEPTLAEIIKQLLYYYNRHPHNDSDIQCVLFLTDGFYLENSIVMPNAKVPETQPKGVRLSISKSDKIVSFEIMDYLERIVNTENILLVADDISYESPLRELKGEGTDIILIKLQTDLGGNLYTEHRWGDIMYPLGLALGLKQHEL